MTWQRRKSVQRLTYSLGLFAEARREERQGERQGERHAIWRETGRLRVLQNRFCQTAPENITGFAPALIAAKPVKPCDGAVFWALNLLLKKERKAPRRSCVWLALFVFRGRLRVNAEMPAQSPLESQFLLPLMP